MDPRAADFGSPRVFFFGVVHRMGRFVLAIILFSVSGCVSTQKVSRLERRMEDLSQIQREQREDFEALDSQLKLIEGRLEQLELGTHKTMGADLNALKQDVSSLRRRVPPPAAVPVAELEEDEVWANQLPAETAQIFMDAMAALRDGRFEDALPLLQAASEQADSAEKAGVVLFWQGVAYDGLRDNKGALRSYAEVVGRFPKSKRAPASLLRQSDVLVRLGDKATARDSLKKLLKDYPKSPEASVAKERLKELK